MKISIIIPTYNRADKIGRAINSVLKQSFNDWELIIVDDASSDNTGEIVRRYQDQDNRISFIQLSKNGGVNKARNIGVEAASGEWLSFLDSDDEYMDDALKVIAESIEKYGENFNFLNFNIGLEGAAGIKGSGYQKFGDQVFFEPGYDRYVTKEGIRGDMHRVVKKEIFSQRKFADFVNGFEHLFYSGILKAGVKTLYINKKIVLVHDQDDSSLSKKPYLRWPLSFAKAYSQFTKEHSGILKKHPALRRHYYLRIAKCYNESRKHLRSLYWISNLLLLQPIDFISYCVKAKK